MLRVLLFCLSILLALGACGTPSPAASCSADDREPFLGSLEPITTRWNATITTAAASDGGVLAASLEQMRDLEGQVQALETPACAAPARDALLIYMGTSIDAYDAKLAGKPQPEVDSLLKKAEDQFAQFTRELIALSGGSAVR